VGCENIWRSSYGPDWLDWFLLAELVFTKGDNSRTSVCTRGKWGIKLSDKIYTVMGETLTMKTRFESELWETAETLCWLDSCCQDFF